MKRNVDLTFNRIFSTQIHRDINSGIPFMQLDALLPGGDLGTMFPWSVDKFQQIHSDKDLNSSKEKEIIITGNASEREHRKYWRNADAGNMCDCCGKDLTVKPWDRHYCLCSNCMDQLNKTVFKGWKYKDDLIDNSIDRIVLEMNFRAI